MFISYAPPTSASLFWFTIVTMVFIKAASFGPPTCGVAHQGPVLDVAGPFVEVLQEVLHRHRLPLNERPCGVVQPVGHHLNRDYYYFFFFNFNVY